MVFSWDKIVNVNLTDIWNASLRQKFFPCLSNLIQSSFSDEHVDNLELGGIYEIYGNAINWTSEPTGIVTILECIQIFRRKSWFKNSYILLPTKMLQMR